MCGICGYVGFNNPNLLKRMCKVIAHRGPDDSGIFLDDNIGLGNRRLSIIDVASGHQPIHNEDESTWITYNGEIYNFLELRYELEKRGHKFYTNSDTEVIVHLYEEFGESCVKKLRGMFAFAIWNSNKKKLFLARDRLGIKPIYYTIVNGKFLFASEIKSILQFSEVERKVNYKDLHNYLTFRYVPGEGTMFVGIKKLLPGHTLTLEAGKITIKKYWDLDIQNIENKSENYYSETLFKLLKESIKMRLITEVPLGAYLSGGIDSSCVVGLMSTLVKEPVKTFSVGFESELADELNYARVIAEHFGTDHREFIVESRTAKLLPKIIWYMDEPNADPAAIPIYLLSELTKKYATVVLVGEGGDEMFAGYQQYKFMLIGKQYEPIFSGVFGKRFVPWLIRKVPYTFLDKFFEYTSALGEEGINRAIKFISTLNDEPEAYLKIISIFTDEEKEDLYSDKLMNSTKLTPPDRIIKPYLSCRNFPLLSRMQLTDIKTWLTHLLMKEDKMTMAKSIEGRVPFLDHQFVEFCNTIPPNLKLRGMKDKYILRKTMSRLIPRTIMKRKKHQFFVPIDTWFEGELGEIFNQVFSESEVKKRKYLKYDYIKRIIKHHKRSKLYYSRQIWTLLIFEFWRKIFIEGNPRKPRLSLNEIID